MSENTNCGVLVTLGAQAEQLPLLPCEEGGVTLRFEAGEGLFQLSVVVDASEFNWDELYVELNAFHNSGQRTGPWDFHPTEGANPLVPSYWVWVDGEKIGLWFFARVSLDDINARLFRGRMAFFLSGQGQHELKLVPYRPVSLRWLSARLEPDPEDSLLPAWDQPPQRALPAMRWREPEFWQHLQDGLSSTHALFQAPLERAFAYAQTATEFGPNEWIVPLAAHRLAAHRLAAHRPSDEGSGRSEALDTLLRLIDATTGLAHWGNQREDGYSHDGDMHAAFALRAMAWMFHALGEELGEERRQRMRDKMALQGRRFFGLTLLNRDYWGGSLLQDHGWKSLFTFAVSAMYLHDLVPEARLWLRYAVPRVRRSLDAMPRDGVVPASSHYSLSSYLDPVSDYRDTLLAWTGQDIYDDHPFRPIVDYTAQVYARAQPSLMIGGNAFFNHMAAKYRDGQAAWVQERLLQIPEQEWTHFMQRQGYYSNIVRGLLSFEPGVPPVEPKRFEPLHFYPDTGLAHYFDERNSISLVVRCGPWVGHHAYRTATGPCDRMGLVPAAGHFVLRRGETDLLASPDAGYALRSRLGSCLLVDGQGQIGDTGYPMSIPSWKHPGYEIELVRGNADAKTGLVRLHLTPAYPEAAGVAFYSREFLLSADEIVCRDYILLSKPKPLSWLFQGQRETGVALDGPLRARFGRENGVLLEAHAEGIGLSSRIEQTPVVWSYASANRFSPFDHVRFDTNEPVERALVDFRFSLRAL